MSSLSSYTAGSDFASGAENVNATLEDRMATTAAEKRIVDERDWGFVRRAP
jgi:hypothetical protein